MKKDTSIKIFEERKIRTIWDSENEKWYLSIVDVIAILTEQPDYQGARNYWKVLKHRLGKEGNETVTNCNRLKMVKCKNYPAAKRIQTEKRQIASLFQCRFPDVTAFSIKSSLAFLGSGSLTAFPSGRISRISFFVELYPDQFGKPFPLGLPVFA